MKKVTLLFPGQGSQYVGMGQALSDTPYFNKMNEADEILSFPLSNLMLNGPLEELTLTKYTQPAILTYSICLFEKVKALLDKLGFEISAVLGHSVGEYAALVAAGVIDFKDAVSLVHNRGLYMQEAVKEGGSMMAILKVPEEVILKACQSVSREGHISGAANFNDPGQIVISGHKEALLETVEWIKNNFEAPFRHVELNVSAPFHSALMNPAAEKMAVLLEKTKFKPNKIPYYANVNATLYPAQTDPSIIKKNLIEQIPGGVLWYQSFNQLNDTDLCLEVGPGKTLCGLAKRINKNIKTLATDDLSSLENNLSELT